MKGNTAYALFTEPSSFIRQYIATACKIVGAGGKKAMKKGMWKRILGLAACLSLLLPAGAGAAADAPFVFGLLLVGPYNDRGYSQAHYEGGRYMEKRIPGAKMIYIDRVNPADRPGVTIPQLVDDMVEKGAKLVIANSDDMKDGIREAAARHPETYFLHVSGDDVLTGRAPKNLSNLFGRMEYTRMMDGFTAAMTTKTGKIGYLGPLINEETRRLAVSSYLGARYAWEKVLRRNPGDLTFRVTWIGFWFNIPGVTADPSQVARNFFDSGVDVVISAIDTTEAVVVARQKRNAGATVWAMPYDYVGACEGASDVCLGVSYYNWGPAYIHFGENARSGRWKQEWLWLGPDWSDINNPDTTAVGFLPGKALSPSAKEALQGFIGDMGSGRVQLFTGPLLYQDGSVFLEKGEVASDRKIWYMKQLLQGMEGSSGAR